MRVASLFSIAVYALLAAIALHRTGLLRLLPADMGAVGIAAWVSAGYFGLGVILNAISRSPPERKVMAPTALSLCTLGLIVARSDLP
jgi:hypothetical protein